MSMYVNFYLKSRDGKFNPIGSFGRSTEVYQTIYRGLPCEKVKPITESCLSEVVGELESRVIVANKQIDDYWQVINEQIPKWNNSISEKMESIANYREAIDDKEQEIDGYRYAIGYFDALLTIIDDVGYGDGYHKDKYIYAGIEVDTDENGNIEVVEEKN